MSDESNQTGAKTMADEALEQVSGGANAAPLTGELSDLHLQAALDRKANALSTVSNIVKLQSETSSTITGNLK